MRSRNIKPGLYKNEVLGTSDPVFSLTMLGLTLLADKAGRLEDRVLRIKAELFPYRYGLDVDCILNWLKDNGFIIRYEVGGLRYIQVVNFSKHQNPHKNEAESEIPAFDGIGTRQIQNLSEQVPNNSVVARLIPDS